MQNRSENVCPADVVLRAVRGRWATSILAVIAGADSISFIALKRELAGISAKVLAEQLRFLVAADVLTRQPKTTGRQEVFYAFTERGLELKGVLDSFNDLVSRWRAQDELQPVALR